MTCEIVLGIDPGPTHTAFARYDPLTNHVTEFGKVENRHALNLSTDREVVCIEMIASYGMPVGKEVFETCVFIGMLMRQWDDATVSRLTRHMVKMHICKSPKANDASIRAALIDRFGGSASIKKGGQLYKVSGDVWAALAVAITAAETTERYTA